MGKPTGFLEVDRQLPADRDPLERVKDWDEFHLKLSEEEIKKQGSRCMDCGVPFCHNTSTISGLTSGCPVNNLIPDWNDMVYKGKWDKALALLLKTNNFPEFTGRVCPAPCEGACVLSIHEPAVTIKNHEYSIIERGFKEGWIKPQPPESRTGKTVAIIGSGPAGLSVAAQLNKAGHKVTVFERDDRPGGLLMYGIPNMKLDKEKVVMRRVKLMEAEGIEFKCSVDIGKDISGTELKSQYDAIILCTGATVPRDLPIEGRDAKGVHFAMDFLRKNTKSLLDSKHEDASFINAKGKDVIVIGGGDTGTDCVATSLRHGCKSVRQLEILDMPPEDRAESNPWPEFPKVYFLDYGQEEAKAKYGSDPREYCKMTKSFIKNEDGSLKALILVDIKWEKGENGRMAPVEQQGTEKEYPADLVLLSMGFLGPQGDLLDQLAVNKTERSNIDAPYGKFNTSVDGVFAAGDCRRGQSLVVWAINEGRAAARECDKFLMGKTVLP